MHRKFVAVSILLVLVFVFVMGNTSFAYPIQAGDQIRISGLSPAATISGGRGGPYTAVATPAGGGYSTTFLTFCLEIDEYLNFSNPFFVGGLSTSADGGGKDADSGDPLDAFTAYLYTKAASGAYLDNQLDEVQFAIWVQEGEIALEALPSAAQSFYTSELNKYPGGMDIGNVRVINLLDSSGHKSQDLIVSVPESPAAATLIFGMCLIGFASYFGGRTRFKRG